MQDPTADEHLSDLAQYLTLQIESAVARVAGKPGRQMQFARHWPIYELGTDNQQNNYTSSNIAIMCEVIAPLLKRSREWTESERLMQQFVVAKTVRLLLLNFGPEANL